MKKKYLVKTQQLQKQEKIEACWVLHGHVYVHVNMTASVNFVYLEYYKVVSISPSCLEAHDGLSMKGKFECLFTATY